MNVGWGMYINLFSGISASPMYTLPLKEDENGEREGSFSIGLSYSL